MFKNIDPSDVSIKPYKSHKSYTISDADSGSGAFGIAGISSSGYAFAVDTAAKTDFTNSVYPYSQSFFHMPIFRQVKHMYYRDWPAPYNSYCFDSSSIRELHGSCTVLTIPRQFFGERVNPYSIKLVDDSANSTFTIKEHLKLDMNTWMWMTELTNGKIHPMHSTSLALKYDFLNKFSTIFSCSISNTLQAYANDNR